MVYQELLILQWLSANTQNRGLLVFDIAAK